MAHPANRGAVRDRWYLAGMNRLLPLLLLAATPAAFALPDTATPAPTSPDASAGQVQANTSYNVALSSLREGDGLEADAARTKSESKRKEQLGWAQEAYRRARGLFEEATQAAPTMAEAWNGFGYTSRKLGDYDAALAAYDKALELKPGYPEAIEYRAEAHLALGRIDEAKQAYLDLFASHRPIADQLLAAMQKWIEGAKAGADAAKAAELSKWVQERAQIAAQTASLTREGTTASW
jgi:tetratricopeptide (TPR) repeat protein